MDNTKENEIRETFKKILKNNSNQPQTKEENSKVIDKNSYEKWGHIYYTHYTYSNSSNNLSNNTNS